MRSSQDGGGDHAKLSDARRRWRGWGICTMPSPQGGSVTEALAGGALAGGSGIGGVQRAAAKGVGRRRQVHFSRGRRYGWSCGCSC